MSLSDYSRQTVAELKELAVQRGIKKPGQGWATCCPPDGNKDAVIKALHKADGASPVGPYGEPKSPPPAKSSVVSVTTPTTDPGTRVQGTSRTATESVLRALGRLENGKLIETTAFEADVTAQLLSEGLKMPRHVPLCTPSFAVRDLAAQKDTDGNLLNEDGIDDRAGRDPWAIMDYVRDHLHWTQDAVFIDKEVFGYYAHPGENWSPETSGVPAGEPLPQETWPAGVESTYVEDGTIRPWCARSPAGGWPVEHRIMSKEDPSKEADSKDQRVRA